MTKISYVVQDVAKGLLAISPVSFAQLFRRPRNLPVLHSDVLRAFRANAGLRAPAILPSELFSVDGPVDLRVGQYGVYPEDESHYLVIELTAILKPRLAIEIGTFRGLVTSLIAMNMPDDGRIYTLDLPDGIIPKHASDLSYLKSIDSHLGDCFRNTPWMGNKIHQLRGSSLEFDFSPFYDRMDLVVVDASHTYAAVFSDSMNAFKMIKPGGVIIWHDYESMRSEYGVNRFVDRLRLTHNAPVRRLSSTRGDTRYAVLRVSEDTQATLQSLSRSPSKF